MMWLTSPRSAVGVDLNVQGRNSGAAGLAAGYERNIGYGDNSIRYRHHQRRPRAATLALIPNALSFEGGRPGGTHAGRMPAAATTANPLVRRGCREPVLQPLWPVPVSTPVRAMSICRAVARVGYNRFENDALLTECTR